jgi:hypothetical protein
MGQTDEGGRCPFLLENDDSKIVICMCNYYSLGQARWIESSHVITIDSDDCIRMSSVGTISEAPYTVKHG